MFARPVAFWLPVIICSLAIPSLAFAASPKTIAGLGSGAGKVNGPFGTAIDQSTGDLYVADSQNFRIDKFDSEGNFLLAWGFAVADNQSLALQTCGPQTAHPRCFSLNDSLTDPGAGNILPESVAVDQASHDVYVADGSKRRITKFGPSGEFIFMIGKNVNPDGVTQEEKNICTATDLGEGNGCGGGGSGSGVGEYFSAPSAIAVDSTSRLWVADGARVVIFDASGHYLSEAAVPSGRLVAGLGLDATAPLHLYALEPDVNERQKVGLSGFGEAGGSFTLGNLPAGCSASATAPITYPAGKPESVNQALVSNVGHALEAKCGTGNFSYESIPAEPTAVRVSFIREFISQNVGQMTCTKNTGAGSCAVATLSDGAPGRVEKLEPAGNPPNSLTSLGEPLDEAGHPRALAVDASGSLYVGNTSGSYHFVKFNSAGEKVSQFGAGYVIGSPRGNALALAEAGKALYVASGRLQGESAVQRFESPEPGPLPGDQRVEDLKPTSATLAASLNPEGHATTYRFQYGTDESYGSETPIQILPGSDYEEKDVNVTIEGLIPETTYHFHLVAKNSEGEVDGEDLVFTTRPAVAINAQWARAVAAYSATVRAQLDPLGAAGEWWLEYGTSPCSEGSCARSGKAALPASFGDIAVGVALGALMPATTYYYRFVAEDERDGNRYFVRGADHSFTTQLATLGFKLADDRAWEMVSPPKKFGASIALGVKGEGLLQAAANGDAVSYLSAGSIEADVEGSRSPERSSVLSRRGSDGHWSSEDISSPNTEVLPPSVGNGFEYKLFSSELSSALLEPRTPTALSLQATERTPYLRSIADPPNYTPLVTGKEGFANVPPGTAFGGVGGKLAIHVAGATRDLSKVVVNSSVPLASGITGSALYEWQSGALWPVSILPESEGGAVVGAELGSNAGSVRGAISKDGSRVFWSTGDYTGTSGSHVDGLYLRDAIREESIRLDLVQTGGFGTGKINPLFQGADLDGTAAFFTDTQNLTEDANESGSDLYRCAVTVDQDKLKCTLADLTANANHPSEGADVQGIVSGMSEDGTKVYFVARGVLGEQNAEHRSPASGEPNLYLWQQGAGIRFITTLAEEDSHDWGSDGSGEPATFSEESAAASPSGRYLAFMSALPLTGYDSRDATSGEADQEIFLYDAEAKGGTGELICASCNPAGVRPTGLRGYEALTAAPFSDPQELWKDGRSLAATLPEASKLNLIGVSIYSPRAVHDNGRLFFNAADSLVSGDSNGNWDVYEYEPTNEGTCTGASGDAGTARTAKGCISLISSGTGDEEAGFIDASEGGSDVFFLTSAQLSVTDEDQVTDVYDARANGIPARLEPSAGCLGEACQPPAVAPKAPTPASAVFRGPANSLLHGKERHTCPKGKRKVRHRGGVRCVKRHRLHHKRARRHNGRSDR